MDEKSGKTELELAALLTRTYLDIADVMAPVKSHPAGGYNSRSEKSLQNAQVEMVETQENFNATGSVIDSTEHKKHILAVKKYEDLDLKFKKDKKKIRKLKSIIENV